MKVKLLSHTNNPEKVVSMAGNILEIDINDARVHNAKNLQVLIDENGCWNCISHKLDSGGYGQYKGERTHVFMYKKYYGEIGDRLVVRHKCDNPKCCNPDHLELGTQKDNAWDRESRGRGNHYTKLTDEIVLKIAKSNKSERDIAKEFCISRGTVNDIKNKRIWKSLLENVEITKRGLKLSEDDIINIYYSLDNYGILADKYEISKTTVNNIKNKKRYKKVTENLEGK